MAKLEQARAEIEQQRIEAMSEDADRKLQDERRFSEMKIEQILSQTKQETELAKRMMELEVQQRKRELEQQYGFVGDDSVPKSILEELWQRRLDKEYPEEGDLDRIMRKYVEPVMAMFQNSNISLPGLPPGGTVQPEGGSLLQGPPNAQGIPEGVDLDEYEEGEAVGFDDIGDVGFGGESESEGEYIEELDDAPFQLPRGNMG